jgi:hypothetical protein
VSASSVRLVAAVLVLGCSESSPSKAPDVADRGLRPPTDITPMDAMPSAPLPWDAEPRVPDLGPRPDAGPPGPVDRELLLRALAASICRELRECTHPEDLDRGLLSFIPEHCCRIHYYSGGSAGGPAAAEADCRDHWFWQMMNLDSLCEDGINPCACEWLDECMVYARDTTCGPERGLRPPFMCHQRDMVGIGAADLAGSSNTERCCQHMVHPGCSTTPPEFAER